MTALSMHETQHLLVTEPAWLTALGARLWVTRQGDPNDYVLDAGQRLAVARGDRLTLGPWDAGALPKWRWQPRRAGRAPRRAGRDGLARSLFARAAAACAAMLVTVATLQGLAALAGPQAADAQTAQRPAAGDRSG